MQPIRNIRTDFLRTNTPKILFAINALLAITYFCVLTFFFPVGNRVLFGLLIAGEVYHLWQVLTFLYTVWDTSDPDAPDASFTPSVDVFITVAGEPVELVERTARAALAMDYPAFNVYLLNDGYVAHKDNWEEIEGLAARLGIGCITRTTPGGAKAGNINNALTLTGSSLVAIFDADHVPHRDFLIKTAGYFKDPKMGFVQTPQFYSNYARNYLTMSSWEQQEIFFGPICKGKNRLNAATMCGTNMLISRGALTSVGGMNTHSIAEDFVTGLLMHASGYRSIYVPTVLAEGLATEDLLTYSKQQFRWGRGALDVIFRWNPLLMRGLTFAQRIQYLSSASFYLSGLFVLIDAMLPVVFFYTGLVPVQVAGMFLASIFLPYFFLTLYMIEYSSNFTFTFSSLCFSMGSFSIQLKALGSALTGTNAKFEITEKRRNSQMGQTPQRTSYLSIVKWHIVYIALVIAGIPIAYLRGGFSASLINNCAWAFLNIVIFLPFIRAALPQQEAFYQEEASPALATR